MNGIIEAHDRNSNTRAVKIFTSFTIYIVIVVLDTELGPKYLTVLNSINYNGGIILLDKINRVNRYRGPTSSATVM